MKHLNVGKIIIIVFITTWMASCGSDDIVNANQTPIVTNPINDFTIGVMFETFDVDLANVIVDPDSDVMTYTAQSSDENVVTTSISDTILTVIEVGTGTATITITGTDPSGESATDEFIITVQ